MKNNRNQPVVRKSGKNFGLAFIVLIFLVFFSLAFNPILQDDVNIQDQHQLNFSVLQAETPTPETQPTEFSEEVIREGRPVGIIVGAVVILLIIVLSCLPALIRGKVYNDNQKKKQA